MMIGTALPRQIILDGTNLFALAAKLYGDATLANIIVAVNALSDPFPQGVIALTIPAPAAGQSGGLPNL